MKVWITEYALSSGIRETEAEKTNGHVNMIQEQMPCRIVIHRKPHWHVTKAEAVAKAETMREARITSLRKQIAKLEKLNWK